MKNKTSILLRRMVFPVAIAALAFGCASPGRPGPAADDQLVKAQIEQRLQEVLVAAESKDFARLDSYHLYGPRFTKFTGSSPARLDADAGRSGEHKGLGATIGLKMRADDLKIDLFEDVAITTFILDYSFNSAGETIRKKERATLVFVKDHREWKIAHEHLSSIPQP